MINICHLFLHLKQTKMKEQGKSERQLETNAKIFMLAVVGLFIAAIIFIVIDQLK